MMAIFTSCSDEGDKPVYKGSRTVLVYMAANNNLHTNGFDKDDIDEMKKGAKSLPDNCRLIVFWDAPQENSKLYRIDKSGMTVIKDYGENLVSTDVSVLKRVLSDAEWKFPADEYGLVMWSHAKGWQPYTNTAKSAISRSFGADTNAGSQDAEMNIPDMADAFRSFPKFKFIMFDACFMQCIEVAYDLKDRTDYILGAPCEIPGTGAYYDKLVPAMFTSNPAQDLVNNYYQPYIAENTADPTRGYGAVMAALDCSQVENFTNVTREVLPQYNSSIPLNISSLQVYLAYNSGPSINGEISPYYDIKGEMQQILSADGFQKWEAALNKLIVAKGSTATFLSEYTFSNISVDQDKFSGLAGYIPSLYPNCEKWDALFRQSNWYKAAGWKEKGW